MLRLPPELIQEIASYIEDLTNFRRVCKTFEANSIDLFASRHLRNITCFVIQPERLLRLNAIANCERLARRVRLVTLTIDPLENREQDEIHAVYRPLEHDLWLEAELEIPLLTTAQSNVAQAYIDECYNVYLPSWSTTHKQLLLLSLNLLKTASREGVAISFTASEQLSPKADRRQWVPNQIRIMQEVVMMVATEGFPISEFGSPSHVFALPALRHRAVDHELLWNSSRELKSINANLCTDHDYFEPDHTGSHAWIQETMLRAAHGLEILNIYCVPVYNLGILNLSPRLLAEIEFTRLRDVNLQQLHIYSSTLVGFLQRCQTTLVKLRMWMINLLGSEPHPWTMPLVLITRFPKLRTVQLLELLEENSQITLAAHKHCANEEPHPFCVLEYDVESGEEHRDQLVPVIERLAGQSYQDLIASKSYQELLGST